MQAPFEAVSGVLEKVLGGGGVLFPVVYWQGFKIEGPAIKSDLALRWVQGCPQRRSEHIL
jgi:hypothetical protein